MPRTPLFSEDTQAAGRVHLRLLATTDLHAQMLPYNYFADAPSTSGGLARAAPLIAELRDSAPNSMLFDNGDLIQGTPLGDFIALEQGVTPARPHPILTAMNLLGYDAGTVGNHEFNYGLEFARNTMGAAAHPVVLSNVVYTSGGDYPFAPYALLPRDVVDGTGARHSLCVGVLGFTPPQILQWDRPLLHGVVKVRDITETARAMVPHLRQAGADIIVALCHAGIGADTWSAGQENAAVPLSEVAGIDAVITGHTHKVFPGPDHPATAAIDPQRGTLNGTPAVMAGFWGSHIGQIDLLLQRGPEGWDRLEFAVDAPPVEDSRACDPRFDTALAEAHRATLSYVRRPIGQSAHPLHGYFAMLAAAPTLQVVQQAQTAFTARGVAGTQHAGLPILSAAAPFKAGGPAGPGAFTDIPAGPLALKHAAELYPYPNSFTAIRVSGAVVRDWLERSAGAFAQVTPGAQDAPLLDPVFPSYDFDVIAGVDYRIDLSQPARFDAAGALAHPEAHRVVDLRHAGRAVEPTDMFLVATHGYRLGGGGGFRCLEGAEVVIDQHSSTFDILVAHLANVGTVAAEPGSHWGFCPMPGTSVVYDTGPGAQAYLGSVAHLQIEDLGVQSNGFRRVRVML